MDDGQGSQEQRRLNEWGGGISLLGAALSVVQTISSAQVVPERPEDATRSSRGTRGTLSSAPLPSTPLPCPPLPPPFEVAPAPMSPLLPSPDGRECPLLFFFPFFFFFVLSGLAQGLPQYSTAKRHLAVSGVGDPFLSLPPLFHHAPCVCDFPINCPLRSSANRARPRDEDRMRLSEQSAAAPLSVELRVPILQSTGHGRARCSARRGPPTFHSRPS